MKDKVPESMEVKVQKVQDLARASEFEVFAQSTVVATILSIIDLMKRDPDDKEAIARVMSEVVDAATAQLVFAHEESK